MEKPLLSNRCISAVAKKEIPVRELKARAELTRLRYRRRVAKKEIPVRELKDKGCPINTKVMEEGCKERNPSKGIESTRLRAK